MKWHLGTLDEEPYLSRSYNWMRRGGWFNSSFPSDVLNEITVFLHTPGLDTAWIARNFRMQWEAVAAYRKALEPFSTVRHQVADNWLSVTRDDAIRFTRLRPRKRSTPPLIAQLRMIDDIKSGMSLRRVARDYGVSVDYVHARARYGPSSGHGKWELSTELATLLGPPSGKWLGLRRSNHGDICGARN